MQTNLRLSNAKIPMLGSFETAGSCTVNRVQQTDIKMKVQFSQRLRETRSLEEEAIVHSLFWMFTSMRLCTMPENWQFQKHLLLHSTSFENCHMAAPVEHDTVKKCEVRRTFQRDLRAWPLSSFRLGGQGQKLQRDNSEDVLSPQCIFHGLVRPKLRFTI